MGNYYVELLKRKAELEKAIASAKMYLSHAPDGRVRATKNGWGISHFYLVSDGKNTQGNYIRDDNHELIKRLIQKEYSQLFLKQASRELRHINSILGDNNKMKPESIHKRLNENKIPMIDPYLNDDEMLIKNWTAQEYNISDYKPEKKIYPTKNGEMVRSKSEAMLADMYNELGIPYRYECELVLRDGQRKYPDFTLLDVKRRKIVYHEHMGLMDDEGYRNRNLNKINEYRKNGIFFGKNLIVTFEADACPLNVYDVRKSVSELLL